MQRSLLGQNDHMKILEVFRIVPPEVKDLLFDYFVLWRKTRNITIQRWHKEYGTDPRTIRDGPDASKFNKDPVEYLIQAHRSVRDFPERLFKHLRVLLLKRDEILTIEEFEELIKYVYFEDAEKRPPTRKIFQVFAGLLACNPQEGVPFPFTSRKRLATGLGMTEDAVRWHIAEMKRRFYLYRLIEVDYYKFGLSKIFLIQRSFKKNHGLAGDQELLLPKKYFLQAQTFPTGIANLQVTYQVHTPPWNRRYDLLKMYQEQVDEKGLDYITEEPDLYLATGRQCFYNLEAFDFKKGTWTLNLRDLRFLVNNSLMTGSRGVFPFYNFKFDINRQEDKQITVPFDEVDLKICEQFWEQEGPRFASVHAVSKALGLSSTEVTERVKRLRAERALYYYYWSALGLSTTLTTVILTKDPFILNNYMHILTELPVSSVVQLESLRDKEIRGLFCQTYLPSQFALDNLIQATFLAEDGVYGICAQAYPGVRSTRALNEYYDAEQNQWKWIRA